MSAYIEIGEIFLELGKPKEARAIFKEAGKKWPNTASTFSWFSFVKHAFTRNGLRALNQWQELIKYFPDHMEAYIQKGYTLIKLEKFAEAESHFKQVIQEVS